MSRRIRGILFDLGDTLIDFGRVDAHALFEQGARLAHEHLQKLGQPVPSFAHFHRRQFWSIRWNYLKSRITGREFNSLDLIRRNSRRWGQTLSDEQFLELAWCYYQPLRDCASVQEGLAEMLEGFRRIGIQLGVVSNTFVPGEMLDRHLAEEGLLDLLPVRVYSCDVRYRKPHPSIFRDALRRLGVPAGEACFVGDSPRADIYGANRAGLMSVLKDPSGKVTCGSARPSFRIRSILELQVIVDRCNGL